MKQTLRELRARVVSGPPYEEEFLATLRGDRRAGAQALYATCLRREERVQAAEARAETMMRLEREAQAEGFTRVAGVDEAGRGPLAGPIVAAAVVLLHPVPGVNDSKQLTHEQRERLFAELHNVGHAIGKAIVSAEEIDHWGIQSANYAAMTRAVKQVEPMPDFLLVDGFSIPGCHVPHRRVVKGDQRSQSIAAASIVAKVVRDRIMVEIDRRHPGYGFARNKGYATGDHLVAIERLGPCPVHRRSFAPIAGASRTGSLFGDESEEPT